MGKKKEGNEEEWKVLEKKEMGLGKWQEKEVKGEGRKVQEKEVKRKGWKVQKKEVKGDGWKGQEKKEKG